MAKVISLSVQRDEPTPVAAEPERGSAKIYNLAECSVNLRNAREAEQDLKLRAQRLGALDGQTVQVCWEEPDAPGLTRYAVGFQYSHTETEVLLAFYTGGPYRLGPTLAIPIAGIRTVLQLGPHAVRF